jgi:hypothetical protein
MESGLEQLMENVTEREMGFGSERGKDNAMEKSSDDQTEKR